jgi:methionine-gamma-lyase
MIFSHQSADQLAAAGIEPGLLRLSVGLEDPQDIIGDIAASMGDTS